MRIQLSLFSLSLVLGVTAGQADIYKTGEGPITISSSTLAGFEKYKLETEPLFFAVANDGKGYGYTQCPPYYSGCLNDTGDGARELCDRKAKLRGAECFTFADGREVVWKGPVTYPDYGDDYLFLFAIGTVGKSIHYGGKGNSFDDGRKIDLSVGECRGEADISTKKWYLKGCKDDISAHGTFVAGSGGEKYYGVGRDNRGVSVEIKLLVPGFSSGNISKAKVSTYFSGGTSEEAIRARIEAVKLEMGREGLNDRPLVNKSKNVICDGLKYKNPDYVEEAKRRGIGAENCASSVPVVKTPQLNVSGKIEERLTKLKELLDKGLLTPDEAAEKRKEILNSL